MKIGKAISQVRKERNLSQTDLAIKSGISNSYLSEIENDRKKPDIGLLERICQELNVPIQILVLKAALEADIKDPEKQRLVREIEPLVKDLADALYSQPLENVN